MLDIMMSLKGGFTLAKEIRQENKIILIIFLTVKSETIDVLEGLSMKVTAILKNLSLWRN